MNYEVIIEGRFRMAEVFVLDGWPRPRGGAGRPAQANEYEASVQESFNSGKINGVTVDASEAKRTEARIRQAAKRQGLGASVQVEDHGDGSATVAFLGKTKRGSAA